MRKFTLLSAFSALVIWGCEYPEKTDHLREIPDQSSVLKNFCDEANREWPENRELRLVFYGHSVPAGYFKTPAVETFSAYPHLVHVDLKRRFPKAQISVIVPAKGGETSEAGEVRFAEDVLPIRPDVLFIDYGLNDRRIGLPRAKAAWEAMINEAASRGILVVLVTPTPDIGVEWDNLNGDLRLHASQINRLASEYSVLMADPYSEFIRLASEGQEIEQFMSQSNHPNKKGHEVVAKEIANIFPSCGARK